MDIALDLDLPGLEQALARLLGDKAEPRKLCLNGDGLRLELEAPFVGRVTLTSRVQTAPGALILSRFAVEDAGLAKAALLGMLQRRIGDLDAKKGPFRIWGEPDGDRLHLVWEEPDRSLTG